MVASAVGLGAGTRIAWLDLENGDERTSAYVVYEGMSLKRVVVLNMVEWRSDSGVPRSNSTFTFDVPQGIAGARVERLTAPGAEVLEGITLGGVSYDYYPAEGKPVVVNSDAANEMEFVEKGMLSVVLQDTECVILHIF